ncbi:endonuclease domain-containing protein [Microbacterium sp. A1-JK]|uniref:endonuclease domain-containing protein n=1 Tax=Microbacterium sp. A1-JK TaxID=3177516 RepID=UPI00388994F3
MRERDLARLVTALRAGGGLVRSIRLVREGHPHRTITAAIERGLAIRVRRSWIALPDADPALLEAARAGVVLSCITQAQRLGLWVLDASEWHVAAPPNAGRVDVPAGVHVHRARPLLPRAADVLGDPIQNVLALVAACQPFETALAVWESALRTQRVDALELQRLPFGARAREILAVAQPFSDSGLESFVLPRLRWMRLRIIAQAWIAGRPVDFLIGDRLVLQIDGGHHVGAQRERDVRHDAELALRGYHVIRVGYRQVVDDWLSVQDLLSRAVAQGLHLAA